ncbi:MAG: RidA family protein [Planctomycetota bacterium]|jgi:enamine deaminase RidA (YjgF/YER057c/UK114 family)
MNPSERLAVLGIDLPSVAAPVGSYVPAIRSGFHVFTSGQLPLRDGELVAKGKVGQDVTLEEANAAAALAGLNALAAAASIAGGVDRIQRIIRVCVFVNSAPGFTDQPKVANGASDLFAGIFDEAGRHCRSAVGVAELPLDAAVELELVVEISGA